MRILIRRFIEWIFDDELILAKKWKVYLEDSGSGPSIYMQEFADPPSIIKVPKVEAAEVLEGSFPREIVLDVYYLNYYDDDMRFVAYKKSPQKETP